MDSDDTSMNIDDNDWKVLGQSVQLSKESQVILNAGNLKSILDNVELYPNIHGWIGDKKIWDSILGKIEERYQGKDTDFKKLIDELIKRAGNYVNFDNDEVNRQMSGIIGGEKSKLSAFSFIMPPWNGGQNPASNTFEETLKNTLEQTVPTKTQAKDFLSHNEEYEFVIVSLTNLFCIIF